ncbi:right-handed parallel beta-helix repeat-containing protein [uncultured Pseudokineococcus sp.]|uniref:right-handed parallel beta-helix repeat-containing protein n=1 Tax=uncultured Pseudokineococcus sp. TaxID=1642928 RepID=UPI00260FB399|nr:right-handed parallel beta-helix repeat-containing protein [uncultured Pseudokineococcus sp.]
MVVAWRLSSVVVALAVALVCSVLTPDAARAEATTTSKTVVVRPGENMKAALEGLRAGDTLLVAPGRHSIGYIRPRLAPGTASRPVTVKAQVWSAPPTLVGGLLLTSPDHWTFHRLRVEGTAARAPGLMVDGGVGWRVSASEFWGARGSDAYANVAIAGGNGYPRGFLFTENCVHDAARSQRVKTDHNIYVKIHGGPRSSGTISRNVIFGHPNGAGIKLGDGGQPGAPGPWGVVVLNNTILDGGRQVLMSHDVRDNAVRGNLLGLSVEPFTPQDRRTTGIYALMVGGTGNVVENNYVFSADMAVRDPFGKVRVGQDTAVRPAPALAKRSTCSVTPTSWQARYYGTTSRGTYLDW